MNLPAFKIFSGFNDSCLGFYFERDYDRWQVPEKKLGGTGERRIILKLKCHLGGL